MTSLQEHHNALLMQHRCAWCAERVPLRALLRGHDCPHCGESLQRIGSQIDMSTALAGTWWGRRLLGYSLVAAASFLSGTIPMLQALVFAAGLLTLHVFLIRRALGWLPPARRISGRFTIKLLGAMLTAVTFVINVAVSPLLGVSAVVLAFTGLLLSVAYVESALWLIRRRVRWECEQRPLQPREWMVPAGLILALLFVVLGSLGTVMGSLHMIATLELPGVSALAEWMLDA